MPAGSPNDVHGRRSGIRDAAPRLMPFAWCELATLRQSLPKIGARIHFASPRPDAALFRLLADRYATSGSRSPGAACPAKPSPFQSKLDGQYPLYG